MVLEEINKKALELWSKNFFNAKRFFDSKGNINTKSKLKDKWHKEFFGDLDKFVVLVLKPIKEDVKRNLEGSQ